MGTQDKDGEVGREEADRVTALTMTALVPTLSYFVYDT